MTPTTSTRRHRARRIRTATSPRRVGSILRAASIASISLAVVSTGATAAHAVPYPVPEEVSATIEFSGATGSWTVPAGVNTITLKVAGEHGVGSSGVGQATGGTASAVAGSVTVTPGQQLTFTSGVWLDGTFVFGAGGSSGQAVWVSLNPPTVSPELTRRSAEARAEAVAAASTVAVAEALSQVCPRAAEGEG